jgi:RND family efflux transporter MFP subunit
MVRKEMMLSRIVIGIGILAAIGIGCGGGTETTETSTERPPVVVRTAIINRADFPVTVRIGGSLLGDRQTVIPAKVTTTVSNVPVRVGQSVKAGDLLVMLDPGGVQSQYNQAKAVFQHAEKQLKKMRNLYDAGAISETQLDGVETEYEVAKANFSAARRSIEIEAPFDGVVTDIFVRAGDEISPGLPLIDVADVKSLRLILEASPAQAALLKSGQSVRVVSPIDSSIVMRGNVYSVADAASRSTRSFEVECRFESPPRGFSPGMYVTAEIEAGIIPAALSVPSEALLYRSGRTMLYIIEADTAALLTVKELGSANGSTAVEGAIDSGQRVVVIGHKNLTPGATVREATQ